jgi:hypothetical protein
MHPRQLLGLCAVLALAGAAAAVLALLAFARHGAGNQDDAFILMVYVRNLIEHGTLEWNVGEGRVDGFTSLLDLLVKAAVTRLSGAGIFQASLRATLAFSILAGWIALAIGYRAGRTPLEQVGLGAAGAWLIASAPANADAAAYLLEGPLFVACALGLVAIATAPGPLSMRRGVGLVLCAWLVVLARPEGLVLAASVLLPTCWQRRHELGPRTPARIAGLFALGVLAYFSWRLLYFGSWAPNTYHAKTSASRWNEIRDGWAYLLAYASTPLGAAGLLPLLIAPAALWSESASPASARWRAGLPAVSGLCMLAVVIGSGGDIYPGGRFLNVVTSLGLVSLTLACAHTTGRPRRLLLGMLVALGLVQGVHALRDPRASLAYLVGLRDSSGVADCDRRVAQRLRQAGLSVGQTDFQRLKFLAPTLRVIDLSGLSDREIAHQPIAGPVREGKFTLRAVVARQPEVFVWGPGFWRPRPITQWSMREIVGDPELAHALLASREVGSTLPESGAALARSYVPASLDVCAASEGYFAVFVRRDVADRLARAGFVIGR